mgnify:CR=1 FL=1
MADRLNLTAPTALTRIGLEINERYRELATSVGLNTTTRDTVSASTVISNRSVTFICQKLLAVYDPAYTPPRVLQERTFDELRNQAVGADPPLRYALQLMGATTVTIFLNVSPATVYTLTADIEKNLEDLSGSQIPAFPVAYHDILIRGVMADELHKMEKYELAAEQEAKFEKRSGDLRLYIAKSAYLQIYQGKRAPVREQLPLV